MNNGEGIPFLDLVTPHQELEEELVSVFRTALRSAAFIGGKAVEEFERAFAVFCDASECMGVGSGTDALRFALIAAGIGAGDAVITVPNTFIATTEAISQAGARPLFVDIDEATYNLDVSKLRELIRKECEFDPSTRALLHKKTGCRVTAIVPVHLYGQMADMDPILELANKYDLIVIEDACQAHGAEYFSKKENRWRKAGSMGKAAAFSFYPGKNLGACGEAGAVTTNDSELAAKIRMLRDHGQSKKYFHQVEGYNGRLDAIQAGILGVKLSHLATWTQQRRAAACHYRELFAKLNQEGLPPYEPVWSKAVYHLYVIRSNEREALIRHLAEAKIGTGIHYPVPLHLQAAYASLGYQPGAFPVSEKVASELVSLPMFPNLSAEQQEAIVSAIATFTAAERNDSKLAGVGH